MAPIALPTATVQPKTPAVRPPAITARRAFALPESVAAFPDGEKFVTLMQKAGFKNTKCRPLAFGICSIYTGVK